MMEVISTWLANHWWMCIAAWAIALLVGIGQTLRNCHSALRSILAELQHRRTGRFD